MAIEIKPIIFGEYKADGLLEKNGKASVVGKCFFCDKDVWISEKGLNAPESTTDHISVPEYLKKYNITRFVHKGCLIYMIEFVGKSLGENLRSRGLI